MKAAIIQSSYIPWKGYFDIINEVDTFVFYDCVQFTKRDWRSRNYIKTPIGPQLMSVPVSGSTTKPINQIMIDQSKNWQNKHKLAFQRNYAKARYYNEFKYILDKIFDHEWKYLSELNQKSIIWISEILGIKTKFIDSYELELIGSKTDRLINALRKLGANEYLTGPSALGYVEMEKFDDAGMNVIIKKYDYPEYPQMWGEFSHQVSILDLLFNTGESARNYIWGELN